MIIAWLIDFDIEQKGALLGIVIGSLILGTIAGVVLDSFDAISKYMIILNASVYFLIMFGILAFLIGAICSGIWPYGSLAWIIGALLGAIISILLTRRHTKKSNKDIDKFVNQHIDDM